VCKELDSNGVLIRVYAKVEDLKKFQVVRDMNRELKIVFEKNNIKFGFPTVNVNEREEEVKKAKD
jgi:small-conductance mechanosensitive channel